MAERTEFRRELGQQLRVDSVRASAAAGSGHPTSSMSAADLIAVLIDGHLRLRTRRLADHLIFSKGHASPLYYAMLKATGRIDDDELLTFRKLGSRLEGHPTPRIPPTDVATGSLGQGLPIAAGVALAGARLDRLPYRVWCLCGDSRDGRGLDVGGDPARRLGGPRQPRSRSSTSTASARRARRCSAGTPTATSRRLDAFGWHAIAIDGHDVDAIEAAYAEAEATAGRPTAIVARTMKGRGVKAVEDQPGKHGKPLDDPEAAIEELGGERDLRVELAAPAGGTPPPLRDHRRRAADVGARRGGRHPQGLRRGAGRARLAPRRRRRARRRGLQLDPLGGLPRGPRGPLLRDVHRRAAARGRRGRLPGPRLGAVRLDVRGLLRARLRLRPHGGDLARRTSGSAARTPASRSARTGRRRWRSRTSRRSAPSTARPSCTRATRTRPPSSWPRWPTPKGISFLRTLRGKTPVRTPAGEAVRIGGSRIVRGDEGDDVAIVACGITVDEAVRAAEALEGEGIAARVLDCYSVKPIDAEALRAAARECGAIVTVEDHWPEGGLGDAVLEALADADDRPPVTKLAVREMPVSGTPEELLHEAGIDAEAIAAAAPGAGQSDSPRRRCRRPGAPRRHGRCTGTGRPPRGRPRSPAPSAGLRRPRRSARACLRGCALRGPWPRYSASGSFCSSSTTGANRSPCSATRSSTSAAVNTRSSGSRDSVTASTSSQRQRRRDRRLRQRPQRVDADRGLVARVLAPVDEHPPLRSDLFISETTSFGSRRSSSWAMPLRERARLARRSTGVLSGT